MKQSERKKVQSILENIRKQHNILESLPEKEVFALLEENQGTIIELGAGRRLLCKASAV